MKFENLRTEMITAMKAHDKERKEVISGLVSAAKKIAIDEGTREDISFETARSTCSSEISSLVPSSIAIFFAADTNPEITSLRSLS